MTEKPRKPSELAGVPNQLLGDIRKMIEEARAAVAEAFADERIVSALMRQLELDYGTGFSEKNVCRMIQFADVFPDEKIVVALIRQLSWTHFLPPFLGSWRRSTASRKWWSRSQRCWRRRRNALPTK